MIKKLIPIGDQLAIVIDTSVLELLRIDRDTPLEVSTDGDSLNIKPVRTSRYQRPLEASSLQPDRSYESFHLLDDSVPPVSNPPAPAPTPTPEVETPVVKRKSTSGADNPNALEAFEKLHDVYVESKLWKQLIALHTDNEDLADWNRLVVALKKMTQLELDTTLKSEIIYATACVWEERLNRLDEAMVLYQKAFSIFPNNIPALKAARNIYRQQKNWKMVETLFQLQAKVIKDPVERAVVYVELGRLCLEEMGKVEKARAAFKRALELDPDSSTVRKLLDAL